MTTDEFASALSRLVANAADGWRVIRWGRDGALVNAAAAIRESVDE